MTLVTDTNSSFGATGRFVFHAPEGASERLVTFASSTRPLDADALASKAFNLPPPNPGATPYADVVASWCDDSSAPPTVAPTARSIREAIPLLLETLDRVLDRLLRDQKRVAVATGGGVDSGSMLALAVRWARRTGGTAFAVALDFEADGDDRPHLRALERHLGCEVVRVAPEDASHHLSLLHGVDGAPFPWALGGCETELLARARAHGASRVLTGAGGDELFDGMPRSLALLARAGHPWRAAASARALRGFERPRNPVLSWVLRPLIVQSLPRFVRRARRGWGRRAVPAWVGPRLRRLIDAEERRLQYHFSSSSSPAARYDDLRTRPHRASIVWLRHQQEVAARVRRCDPYLDFELMQMVTSLNPEWLLEGNQRRGLLREAMRGILPDSVRERMDKSAFEPALERYLAAVNGSTVLAKYTRGQHLAELGIVSAAEFEKATTSFLAKPTDEEWVTLWPALAVEAFLQRRGEA